MKKCICIVLLLALLLTGCTQNTSTSGMKAIHDSTTGLGLYYPREWTPTTFSTGSIQIASPKEGSLDPFLELVTLSISNADIDGEITLDQCVASARASIQKQAGMQNITFNSASLQDVTFVGNDGKEFVLCANFNGRLIKLYQALTIIENRVIIYTFMALVDEYDRYELPRTLMRDNITYKKPVASPSATFLFR